MELNISDLLDDLTEIDLEIQPFHAASGQRIEELTMKKIHTNGKYLNSKHRRGYLGKLILAAVLVTALAIPVLAASVFFFADWSAELMQPKLPEYDSHPAVGSQEKTWIVPGATDTAEDTPCNWAVKLSAKHVTGQGLTLIMNETGTEQKTGSFTAGHLLWLEKWNGNEYVPLADLKDTEEICIEAGGEYSTNIDWMHICGTLESGSYRIGRTFLYTSESAEPQEFRFYAKFRILSDDFQPYLSRYQEAFQNLCTQENLHIRLTSYVQNAEYSHYTQETWKCGEDYLVEYTYYNFDGSVYAHSGHMFRDGMGYGLSWVGARIASGVASWTNLTFVDAEYNNTWMHLTDITEALIGQVYAEGNTISFFEHYDDTDESQLTEEQIAIRTRLDPYWNYHYTVTEYHFDDQGRIRNIVKAQLLSPAQSPEEGRIFTQLEVFDTSAEDIRSTVYSVDVSMCGTFSWPQESVVYGPDAIQTSFHNTSPTPISTPQEAIQAARREAVPTENPAFREFYEYNVASVYFDEEAQMWKIHFWFSQDKAFTMTVYLNAEGITQMLVFSE